MSVYDIIIIGGGPAGYTAALYAARAGFNTLVIERMSAGGQLALTDVVDNYPGFDEGIDGFTLGMKMQSSAERFGAVTEYAEVTALDLKGKIKKVITDFGEFEAKTVIIATGANPRELNLPREKELLGKGVHYCAHCDGRFYRDKIVAVVGGGNSAVSDALYLSRLAKKVYLIHRRDTLRATKIYHEPLKTAENIEFIPDSIVAEFLGEQRVSGAKLKNLKSGEETEISSDGIFVSIGREPATGLLNNILDLDEYGYIIADETTKTSIEGVFAVGDVRQKALRQIVTAVSDGATAVHFAEEYLSNF
ncbi:MAG: thioredoxin-disulfide reductase [Ruminococcaceae bacterium]|nr:thioredoxin-disulfide reductase [Oscillospiraceae bacterium]